MAHRDQIKQMCRPYSKDTENRAYEIDQQIRLACRDGSGFAIPLEGRIGVAAIAVYLASEQLNNGEVKESDARIASCLQPKIFKQALGIVRSALEVLYKKQAVEERSQFYTYMLKKHNVGQQAALRGLMVRAEIELLLHGKLRSRYMKPYDGADDIVRATVFVWACDRCGAALHRMKRGISISNIAERYNFDSREMAEIYNKLENVCHSVGEEIEQEVAKMKAVRVGGASARSSPTKLHQPVDPNATSIFTPARPTATSVHTPTSLRLVSPIKSAMRRKAPEKSAMKTPTHNHKRTLLNDDIDTEMEDTPSKPRKKLKFADDVGSADLEAMAAFHAALATPRPFATPTKPKRQGHPIASSSRAMPEATSNNMDDEDALPTPRAARDVTDVGLQFIDDGLHSELDYQASEMEVETYIDTTVPVKGVEDDEEEDVAAALASEPDLPSTETPQRTNPHANLPLTPSSNHREPVTPSRTPKGKRGRPTKNAPTPKSARKAQLPALDKVEEETDAPLRRRHRPILLSHRQWAARDPRTREQAQQAEAWKAKMIEQYGYPPALDKLRTLAIQSN